MQTVKAEGKKYAFSLNKKTIALADNERPAPFFRVQVFFA